MMQIDVKRVLMLWGGFVRFMDCKGYPTMESFIRESPEVRTNRRYSARLDDETLEKVDKQVRKLKKDSPQQFDILFLKYVCSYENRWIWQKLSLSKGTFDNELRLAERFVEGALAGSEIRVLF